MPVDIEQFDPNDKTLLGPAEEVLLMPGVILTPNWTPDMATNPDGTPKFDYTRKQQTWKVDPAVIPEDVDGYRLVGGVDNPKLVQYFVPKDWARTPNIQTNPSMDKVVFPYAPVPLRALAADEHLVVVRAGTFFPLLFVRKGEKPSGTTSTGGGGMTAAQEAKIDEILMRVRSLTV